MSIMLLKFADDGEPIVLFDGVPSDQDEVDAAVKALSERILDHIEIHVFVEVD